MTIAPVSPTSAQFETWLREMYFSEEDTAPYEQGVPERARKELEDYICKGTKPSLAMQILLANTLDKEYLMSAPAILSYIDSVVPSIAQGNWQRVDAWPQYRETWEQRWEDGLFE